LDLREKNPALKRAHSRIPTAKGGQPSQGGPASQKQNVMGQSSIKLVTGEGEPSESAQQESTTMRGVAGGKKKNRWSNLTERKNKTSVGTMPLRKKCPNGSCKKQKRGSTTTTVEKEINQLPRCGKKKRPQGERRVGLQSKRQPKRKKKKRGVKISYRKNRVARAKIFRLQGGRKSRTPNKERTIPAPRRARQLSSWKRHGDEGGVAFFKGGEPIKR